MKLVEPRGRRFEDVAEFMVAGLAGLMNEVSRRWRFNEIAFYGDACLKEIIDLIICCHVFSYTYKANSVNLDFSWRQMIRRKS